MPVKVRTRSGQVVEIVTLEEFVSTLPQDEQLQFKDIIEQHRDIEKRIIDNHRVTQDYMERVMDDARGAVGEHAWYQLSSKKSPVGIS